MSVVEKQIKETLKEKQPTLDVFKTYINNLKVDNIIGMIQGSGTSIDLKSKPVAHLRERIVPELIELVKNQRLNLLVEGTRFEKQVVRKKAKDNKYWYCRLSQNRRFLHYGSCDEGSKPNTDQLPNKFSLAEIEDLKTGADCPHTQEAIKIKKTPVHLAFSLIMKEKAPLNFIAPNEEAFDLWVDGLSILIGKSVSI
ncbi:engulfment and cell motility 1 [Paramuricea clavata]|uniref:Engulfment and cell motility 1 n=1 Tax=Paramuricea clavata TaxID=317549 RepID=A0A7D9EVR9_PARCT|nr:engulfment and cell motility 1 [Paramuricea clavata]